MPNNSSKLDLEPSTQNFAVNFASLVWFLAIVE